MVKYFPNFIKNYLEPSPTKERKRFQIYPSYFQHKHRR